MTRNEIIAHLKKFKPKNSLVGFDCDHCPLALDNLLPLYKKRDELFTMRCSDRLKIVFHKLGKKLIEPVLGCGRVQSVLISLEKELSKKEYFTMQTE
jgi:hypothetical protein